MTTTEIIFLLCLIIICGVVIILIVKWAFTAKENRELKQENKRDNGRIKELSSLLKSEEEISKAHFDKTIQLSLEKAELQSRVDKFNISQEWQEQHQKEMAVIDKAIQDKMFELQALSSACDTTKKEVEELKLNKEQLQHKTLQFESDIENLQVLLQQKQAAWSAVDHFEKIGFGDGLPYIDYEEYFSKNNFETVLKLLDDCINVAPQFKSELRKIEWSLCYLPYKKSFIKDFSRSGIYMLEVKSKYENEVLKELGLKRVDNNGSIVYIGQAVNIYDRWTTHIKKMLEIEPKGDEKLYKFKPLMFKWKVIEWCDSIKLNEREKFWIDSFKSDEFGLNSKGGNK